MFFNKMDKDTKQGIDQYDAARSAKESLGLLTDWREYEDYCRNVQNTPETDEDPGSVTNVIFPVIVSQVSDLVDEPLAIQAIGEEASDQIFARDVEHILSYIDFRNKMFMKLDRFESRRLKFGTSIWKVYYDPLTHMVVIDPISPVNFFPDPKIKEPWHLDWGDFVAHVNKQPINYLKSLWGSKANEVKVSRHDDENLSIFEGETIEDVRQISSNEARVIEIWTHEAKNKLRRRVIAGEVTLYDSKKDNSSSDTFYEHGRYPFDVLQCYPVEGRLWGMGDVELLKPTQDLINDLDDQIRLNARLMGNIQVVVGLASGINIRKWTAKAGLKIPAKDHTAWQAVNPPPMPEYILARRNLAMQEAEVISGRPDVTEGRRSGVRAASAIMALQEAGSRRAKHKKMYLQNSLSNVYEFAVDYLKEFFTEEQAFRILGNRTTGMNSMVTPQTPQYVWFKGSSLKTIPRLIQGPNGQLVPLKGNDGQNMTKDARYDVRVSVGAGLPHNQAFLYQAIMEMVKEQIITKEEARYFVKDVLDWPVANPDQPSGDNFGLGVNPQLTQMLLQLAQKTGQGGQVPGQTPQLLNDADVQSIPPQIMDSLIATMGGQGGPR